MDQSSPAGLTQNQSLHLGYSFPANGVGKVGSGATAILISGHKLVFINNTSANPTIIVVEKQDGLGKTALEKIDYSERAPKRRRTTPAEAQ